MRTSESTGNVYTSSESPASSGDRPRPALTVLAPLTAPELSELFVAHRLPAARPYAYERQAYVTHGCGLGQHLPNWIQAACQLRSSVAVPIVLVLRAVWGSPALRPPLASLDAFAPNGSRTS